MQAMIGAKYDDHVQLVEYLWRNYLALFSDHERLAAQRLLAEAKAASTDSERIRTLLRAKWSQQGGHHVDKLLSKGPEEFRVKAAQRVLASHNELIFINRCPECKRIVKTLRAKQCLWCGFDWHNRQ